MNQYDSSLTAAILAAAAQPQGLDTSKIPGFTTPQVGRMAQKMMAKKQLFCAKLSHKVARYFDSYTKAVAFEARHKTTRKPNKRQVDEAQSLGRLRAKEAAAAEWRASNQSIEGVTDENTVYTIVPKYPDHRFVVTEAPRIFRSMPLGSTLG